MKSWFLPICILLIKKFSLDLEVCKVVKEISGKTRLPAASRIILANQREDQKGEVNMSDLADPMIMAIVTSRRTKRANAQNFADTTFWDGFLQSFQFQMVLYLDLKE